MWLAQKKGGFVERCGNLPGKNVSGECLSITGGPSKAELQDALFSDTGAVNPSARNLVIFTVKEKGTVTALIEGVERHPLDTDGTQWSIKGICFSHGRLFTGHYDTQLRVGEMTHYCV